MSGITNDNVAGDTCALGHNTDTFDVGSRSNIYISGGAKVCNQDGCLAINSVIGMTFIGGYCSGSHGLSIGSVGGLSDNTVNDITISSPTVTNSQNGVRIKTVYKQTGSVSAIVYKDISLSDTASMASSSSKISITALQPGLLQVVYRSLALPSLSSKELPISAPSCTYMYKIAKNQILVRALFSCLTNFPLPPVT